VTAKPQPTGPALTVLNIKQEKQADGSIRTTANVSTQESLGVGQVELAYPEAMQFGDSTSMRLRLSQGLQLAALTPVAAPARSTDTPGLAYQLGGNVQLYPIMLAQLRATAFDIDPKQVLTRIIQSGKTAEWVWVIKPTMAGRHELLIELSIPIIINGVAAEMSTHVLQDLTVTIQVNAPIPTAVPTVPLSQRITDSMVNNAGAIVAALIGIIGTILAGIFALANRKKPN
jgi:hypothetical protein